MAYRTTPKMKRRMEAKRTGILHAATRLFGEDGYHKTTVPRIVAEAGSSTGSFYFYFRNKEDVFAAVQLRIGEAIAAALNEEIAARTDPLEQMKAAVVALFLFLAQHPREARIMLVESSGLGGRIEQTRRDILASHTRSVEKALVDLSGRLQIGDPKVAARCWAGSVYEAVRYWLEEEPDKRPEASSIAEEVAQFNLRGIGVSLEPQR